MVQTAQFGSGADLQQALPVFLQHCGREKYPANTVIIRAGEGSRELFYLLKGSVAVSTRRDGHELVLAYLREGDFFGEIALFDERHLRSATVKSRTRCEVATITYERLRAVLEASPEVLYEMVSQLALRLRDTDRKAHDLAFVDVSGRVAAALLNLTKAPEAVEEAEGMRVRVTRTELGRLAGCSREVAGRVLKHLEQRHVVSTSGRNVLVHWDSLRTS